MKAFAKAGGGDEKGPGASGLQGLGDLPGVSTAERHRH
jgi:hypothetical protein